MGFLIAFLVIGFIFCVVMAIISYKKKHSYKSHSVKINNSSLTPKDVNSNSEDGKDFDAVYAYSNREIFEKVCPVCGYPGFTKSKSHIRCQRCAHVFSFSEYNLLNNYSGVKDETGILNVYPRWVIDNRLLKFDDSYKNIFLKKYNLSLEEYYSLVTDDNNFLIVGIDPWIDSTDSKEKKEIRIFENFILFIDEDISLTGKIMQMIDDPLSFMEKTYRNVECIDSIKNVRIDQYGGTHCQIMFKNIPSLSYVQYGVPIGKEELFKNIMKKLNVKNNGNDAAIVEFKNKYGIDWEFFNNTVQIKSYFLSVGNLIGNTSEFVTVVGFGSCFIAVPKSDEEKMNLLFKERIPNLTEISKYLYLPSDVVLASIKRDSFNITITHKPNILDAAFADAAFGTAGVAAYVAANTGTEVVGQSIYDHLTVKLKDCPFNGFVLTKSNSSSIQDNAFEYFKRFVN